jgi:hypothetical protein
MKKGLPVVRRPLVVRQRSPIFYFEKATICLKLVFFSFLGPKAPKEKKPKVEKPKKEKVEKPKKEKAPKKSPAKPKGKKANPWDDDDSAGSGGFGSNSDADDDFAPVAKKERDGTRRAATAKSKYVDDSGSDSDMFA